MWNVRNELLKTSYIRTQTTVYLRTYPTIQFCGSVTIPVRTYIPIPKQSIPLLYSSWVNRNLAKWETTELKRGNQPEQGREQRKTPSLGTCKHLSLHLQTHNHCVNVLHLQSQNWKQLMTAEHMLILFTRPQKKILRSAIGFAEQIIALLEVV